MLIQCKAHTTTPPGPNFIRELSGTVAAHSPSAVAFLVSIYPCTPGARNALRFATFPMGYLCISKIGIVRQFIWNQAAASLLGARLGVGIRHLPPQGVPKMKQQTEEGAPSFEQEVVLMWNGEIADGLLVRQAAEIEKARKKQTKKKEKKKKTNKNSVKA